MNNINNLKISKLGWTSLCMKRENGKVECILVKKNLFKGYTVLDASGNKVKIPNLDSLCNLTIISHSKKMFASKNEVTSINDAFQYTHNEQVKNEEALLKQQEMLKANLRANEEKHEKQIDNIQEATYQERIAAIKNRIGILEKPFRNVMKVEWTDSGVDIEYKQPNELQRKHFGMTVVPERVPYSKSGTSNWGMKDYLDILITKVDDNHKFQIQNLRDILNNVNGNISSLKKKYIEELYIQTVALVTKFSIEFSNFLISYYQCYGNKDLSYYQSSSSYEQNGEKSDYTQSSNGLIQQGKMACASLLENIMGLSEKDKFLTTIDSVSNTYVEEETPKQM